jgi:hypothetical protein
MSVPLLPRSIFQLSARLLSLGIALGASACESSDLAREGPADGSFGSDNRYPSDASLDGGTAPRLDAGLSVPAMVRVRFTHGIPNSGALSVCHDPDGPGPMRATLLREETRTLRAEFGAQSATITVPAIESGELTLQREARTPASDSNFDGGAGDGGATTPLDPCDPATREATISLPITGRWLDPREPARGDALLANELSSKLAGAAAFTLLGSGFGLNPSTLERREKLAYDSYLQANPGAADNALDAGRVERAGLEAAFGPRALIEREPQPGDAQRFSLSVFHAVADVLPLDAALIERQVGAVRLCVTAGTRESSALPKAPAEAIPFRVRKLVGSDFDPKLPYEFRVFAQRDLDAPKQDCPTTGLMPIARSSWSSFEAGKSYTLAVVGAIAPSALCSANDVSLARASCQRPASELAARIQLLENN